MNEIYRTPSLSLAAQEESARFMSRVYRWMTFAILVSGGVAWYISQEAGELLQYMVTNTFVFYGLIIAEVAMVAWLSMGIRKMSATTATLAFLLYAALSGATLSVIFLVYTRGSIAHVFGITAFAFAGLSAFGLVTKRDLGPVGSFCTMGLFGMVGFALLSWIWPGMMSSTASQVYGVVGVIVFSGLTAYDTQKIKAMNVLGNEGSDENQKDAIFGALTLYLDFINLFLSLLRLTGDRRR